MREPQWFTAWLDGHDPSTLTVADIKRMSIVDVTTKLSIPDLTAIMYYGESVVSQAALDALKQLFEFEMNALSELNQHQGDGL